MKYAISSSIRYLSKEDFLKRCTDADIDNNDKIVQYMRSFEPECFSSAFVIDIVNGFDTQIDDTGFTDGEYTWYTSWIYHFEKYNLKLNDDFIAHVLSKIA